MGAAYRAVRLYKITENIMRIEEILSEVVHLHRKILGENLIGIYIHGSLAFGCFHPEQSDIDFLAVTERSPTLTEKRTLLARLALLEKDAPRKGFEMSVVLAENCRRFVYPTPYELHYSKMHRKTFLAAPDEYCKAMHGTDPDLAAHFTVVRETGITLYGEAACTLFAPVPRADYLDSIRRDAADAEKGIERDPVYFVLNLCRVLAYLREGLVLSKADGGQWGIKELPELFHSIIREALRCYAHGGAFSADRKKTREFARYMLTNIFAE